MSFKNQMKELQSSSIGFKEKRIIKLDSAKYDEFASKVCQLLENDMKKKIFAKRFSYDKRIFGKTNCRYEAHGEFGLSIYSRCFFAKDYEIKQLSDAWGSIDAFGVYTCYWEDISQVIQKIMIKLQEDDFDGLTMSIVSHSAHQRYENDICSEDIIPFLKKTIQEHYEVQNPYILSSCVVHITATLNCTNIGEI